MCIGVLLISDVCTFVKKVKKCHQDIFFRTYVNEQTTHCDMIHDTRLVHCDTLYTQVERQEKAAWVFFVLILVLIRSSYSFLLGFYFTYK